ncbi:hypothetical protein Pelo_13373 [Pelomyxa schiedti]|nr:hypothetical protein Pelo_13373 [Pelomyxa schiedti]
MKRARWSSELITLKGASLWENAFLPVDSLMNVFENRWPSPTILRMTNCGPPTATPSPAVDNQVAALDVQSSHSKTDNGQTGETIETGTATLHNCMPTKENRPDYSLFQPWKYHAKRGT